MALVGLDWLGGIGWIGLVGFGLVCFIYFQMNLSTSSVKKVSKSQISFEIDKF